MPKQKPKEKKQEDKVLVPKSFLEDLQKDIEGLKKDRNILLQVADKRQMAHYYERNKEKLPSVVKLRMMRDKVIVGWRTVEDEVHIDPTSHKEIARQIIQVIYEDGTDEKFNLLDYVRNHTFVKAKVLSQTKEEGTDKLALKVERIDNGKIYNIGVEYVN